MITQTANSMLLITKKTLLSIGNNNPAANFALLLLAALAPLASYIHFLVFLLFADAATSIYYQYKQKIKEAAKPIKCRHRIALFLHTIESEKLRRTFEKLIAYILGIVVAFFFDKIVLQISPLEGQPLTYFSLTNVSVLLICSVEVVSIFANLSNITGNPIYKRLIKILNKKVDDKIDQL